MVLMPSGAYESAVGGKLGAVVNTRKVASLLGEMRVRPDAKASYMKEPLRLNAQLLGKLLCPLIETSEPAVSVTG